MGHVWNPDSLKDEPIAENDHFCDMTRYASRWAADNLGGLAGENPYLADYAAAADARLPGVLRGR